MLNIKQSIRMALFCWRFKGKIITVFTEVLWCNTIQLLSNKITPHFQLLPMSKVDQSKLGIHEVPPLQYPKSPIIPRLSTCTLDNPRALALAR